MVEFLELVVELVLEFIAEFAAAVFFDRDARRKIRNRKSQNKK